MIDELLDAAIGADIDVPENIFELYRRNAEADEQRRKPQPTKTVWAIGSMEWLAEQKKSR